jgi:catechol 2,3-dioxygenase-like lactoylglutathione lyase family enzyme
MSTGTQAGPLAGASLSTVVIYVRDLARMLAFYRETLGLRVEHETGSYAELGGAGGAGVALHAGRGEGEPDRHWFIEFRVADVAATAEALRARGVAVGEVTARWWGKEASFSDPEGNRIELEQPDAEGVRRGPPR